MPLDKRQTMALYKKCNTFGANASQVAIHYVCPSEAARTSLEMQLERAMVTCPPLERKTPVVHFDEKPLGIESINPGYDTNHCVLDARIGFVPTAAGLANQKFTSMDLQKLAGTLDLIGCIDFNVKFDLLKRASAVGAGKRTP